MSIDIIRMGIIILLDFIRSEVININLIKKLRVNQEMTQMELANACGVTQGTVAMWESGRCFPKAALIGTVARALGCESEMLLRMAEERRKGVS